MKRTLLECLMGGPGHDGYSYMGDVYCVSCGHDIIRAVFDTAERHDDSEDMPQPIFFGESPDGALYCAECLTHLYGTDSEES